MQLSKPIPKHKSLQSNTFLNLVADDRHSAYGQSAQARSSVDGDEVVMEAHMEQTEKKHEEKKQRQIEIEQVERTTGSESFKQNNNQQLIEDVVRNISWKEEDHSMI